jgi:hypothetical protein
MIKTSLLTAALVMAASGLARAGGQEGSVGVGAEVQLSGISGVSVNYDAGAFHVGGLLGYGADLRSPNPDVPSYDYFQVGARFYYHVHSTAMSDFGLGGNLGIASVQDQPMDKRSSYVYLEPGLQIRLFLAANVALAFTGGVAMGLSDADGVFITGQGAGFNFGGGVHYYFF